MTGKPENDDMKKLAIAVPTYKRPGDIDFFIKTTSFIADYKDVDLLIYDSSEDDRTESVVKDNNKDRESSEVILCKVPSEIPSNEKLYYILNDICGEYSYIWVIHDHTVFKEEAFRFLYESLDGEPDFIYLKMHCPAGLVSCNIREENDREKFLYDSAWFLGKIGAAVVRSGSFINGIDWERYRKKYLSKELINFSHIGLYFERLAEMDDPVIRTIEFPRECFKDTYSFKTLAWNDEMVRICTECWGSVIDALPDLYRNKEQVMRTIDEHLITEYKLLELKERGLYGFGSYLRYGKWLKKTFPKVCRKALFISLLPTGIARRVFLGDLIKRIDRAEKEGVPVYIYGAGRHGFECLETLLNNGMDCSGFAVTSLKGNPENINGYAVKTVDEVLSGNKRALFILAIMDIYKDEVMAFLEKKNSEGAGAEYVDY